MYVHVHSAQTTRPHRIGFEWVIDGIGKTARRKKLKPDCLTFISTPRQLTDYLHLLHKLIAVGLLLGTLVLTLVIQESAAS